MTRKVEQALAARIGGEHAIISEVKAQLAEAKLNLSWTRIYAPANGYITDVHPWEEYCLNGVTET
jgi:multidrug resistance efflux pump